MFWPMYAKQYMHYSTRNQFLVKFESHILKNFSCYWNKFNFERQYFQDMNLWNYNESFSMKKPCPTSNLNIHKYSFKIIFKRCWKVSWCSFTFAEQNKNKKNTKIIKVFFLILIHIKVWLCCFKNPFVI